MKPESPRQLIIKAIKEKTSTKMEVFHRTIEHFEMLREVLRKLADDYNKALGDYDNRIEIDYRAKGFHDAKIKIGGDTLLFHMHTNVFSFDESHNIWNYAYVQKDKLRAYCGMINVYNFLSDSFKYNRVNDAGYLIARIFINKEDHFFVDGKRQLGFLYNDFPNAVIDEQKMGGMVESCIAFALDFDLLTPHYEQMNRVTLHQIMELTKNVKIPTDKRLGFRFKSDQGKIE